MRDRFVILLMLVFSCTAMKGQGKKNPKPNVILIYVDDLGYGDVSCYGATGIKTPNVDAIAKNGLLFTNGHSTSATCTPSRYGLITGEYPWRKKGTGILPGDAALIIPKDKITLPGVFKRAGYQTAVVGKWHLGLGDEVKKNWNAEIKPGPNEVGFDYSFIFPATADRVPTVFLENHLVLGLNANDSIQVSYKENIGNEPTGKDHAELLKLLSSHGHNQSIVNGIGRIGYMSGGKQARWTDEELAPVFLSKAQSFIRENRNKPFFLYYALNDIHVPRMPSTMFKGKSSMGYRGDAILEMDWIVGEITNELKSLGLDKNTMIIFSSDNGPVLDDGYVDGAVEKLGAHKPAGPLRGWKGSVYEGGTRIPLIWSWPGYIKPGRSDAMVNQIDFLSSFSAFFNQDIKLGEARDSENIWGAFVGKTNLGRTEMIEHGSGDVVSIVCDGWKYIPAFGINKTDQLFNLAEDIGEKNNMATENPDKLNQLKTKLAKEKSK